MIIRITTWFMLLWIIVWAVLFPTVALAATTDVVVITASPALGNECISNYSINVVSLYEIKHSWTAGNSTTGSKLVAAYGRWPTSPTDGFEVYSGTGNATTHWVNTEFIGVNVYYRVYAELGNGTYSSCYASGSVTGGEAVGTMSLGILAILPIGLMALSMAWYRITGKDGWHIMIGAGLAWLALGAYGFASSVASWDIYQITGSVSMAMLVLCTLLSYEGSRARRETIQAKTVVKVEPVVPKNYGERMSDYEARAGLKSKEQLRQDIDKRIDEKLNRRLEG